MTAPLQVLALTFRPGADSEDRILAEVDQLQGRGVLRVLDMVVLAKDQAARWRSWRSAMTRTSARSWAAS